MSHLVAFEIEEDGTVTAAFSCTEPVGANCRLECVEDCEYFTFEGHGHELRDSGDCGFVMSMDALDRWNVFESYEGPDAPLGSGEVIFRWDSGDESVRWRFPAAEPGDSQPGAEA